MQDNEKKIVVGICAMSKKTQSKPMQEILNRLDMFEYITIDIFAEDTIVNKPIGEWPMCDCLISFHSNGKSVTGLWIKAIKLIREHIFIILKLCDYLWLNLSETCIYYRFSFGKSCTIYKVTKAISDQWSGDAI